MSVINHLRCCCVFCAVALSMTCAAVTRYVWQGGSHTAPYTTWATAATNISAANAVALAGDELVVTNGSYSEPAVLDLNRNALILRSVNGPGGTIIDGNNARRVLYSNNRDVQVHGFTIRHGAFNGNGAGLYIDAASTLVSNCVIIGNATSGDDRQGAGLWANRALAVDCLIASNAHTGGGTSRGGGVYCENTARLLRCRLHANAATYGGGAVMNATSADTCTFAANTASARGAGAYADGAAFFTNCTFEGNLQNVLTTSGNGGGGIYFAGAGAVIASRFCNNEAIHYGGAAFINGVAARVVQSTFTGNRTTLTGASTGGGAMYISGNGFVTECLISGNLAMNDGGGVLITDGGSVNQCRFANNTAGDWGGGLAIYSAGAVTNSLFYGNIADEGGGIYNYGGGGRIHSCTVVKNSANIGCGGIDCGGNTLVRNAIVYDNIATVYTNYRFQTTAARWRNCCTWPAVTGAPDDGGNITNNPRFVAAPYNQYWLATNSPCVNAGFNEAWMATAGDLDGRTRIVNAIVDIGAYELGALMCALSANRRAGRPPLTVDFSSYVSGTNTTALFYFWDFNYPSGFDVSGAGVGTPSWTYTNEGIYTVYLMVSNAVGETAVYLATDFIIVVSEPRYVATNGPHIAPFTSWATAASNIESAVAISFDYMQVFVSAGTYRVAAPIVLTNAVDVFSVCGPERTVVDGAGTSRCFYIATDAQIAGFTISNGSAAGAGIGGYGGGALCFNGGYMTNCIFVGNHAAGYGGAIACYGGGTVFASFFASNTATRGGAAVCYNQGLLVNCIATANRASDSGGAFFCDSYGIVRNCLAYGNRAATNGGAISVQDSGGIVQSCTVVSNEALRGGGIHSQSGGNYYNTISYFNTAAVAANSNWYSNVVGTEYDRSFEYCCTAPLSGLPNQVGCISSDPQFRDRAARNFRLRPASACINAGINQAWMYGAVDLDGAPRLREGRVDIGAYEYFLASLLITNTANGSRFPFWYLRHLMAGTSTGLVGYCTYTNRWSSPGQAGIVAGTLPAATAWNVAVHLPHYGVYTYTIVGSNAYGDTVSDSISLTRKQYKVYLLGTP